MPAELIGIVSQVDWSAGHAQVAEQIDKIKVAVESVADTIRVNGPVAACRDSVCGAHCGLGEDSYGWPPIRMLAWTAYLPPRSGPVDARETHFPKHWERCPGMGPWGSLIPCRTHFRLVCRNDRGVHDR